MLLLLRRESTLSEQTGERTVAMPTQKTKERFFEPMLLLATSNLPQGDEWGYELKLDGYRAIALRATARYTCALETIKTSR